MSLQGLMEMAFIRSLQAAPANPSNEAAVSLALRYAQLLDAARGQEAEASVFADLGPKYLAALTALGMTAAGHPLSGGVPSGSAVTPLQRHRDELATRRAQRQG